MSSIPEPIMPKAECDIYNLKGLAKKHNIKAKNDAELALKLLKKKGLGVIDEFDGVYAIAYLKGSKLYLLRDLLGVKPLWYSHSGGFAYASEAKALDGGKVEELNPRNILIYDIKKNRIHFEKRDFFSIKPEVRDGVKTVEKNVEKLLLEAVKKRIPKEKFGILFSGGIDSTVLALICKKLGAKFTCYTTVLDHPSLKEPEDLKYALKAAKVHGFELKIIRLKLSDVEKDLKKVIPLIEDANVVKASVGATFFAACEKAGQDGCKVIFSGLGSEEIFAGYQRHKDSKHINQECMSGLLSMHERDTYRDYVISRHHNLRLRVPFLDHKLVEYALRIPGSMKIKGNESKVILRKVAKNLGVADEFCRRKKKAAQYGSNLDKAISKLAKNKGFKFKSDYLRSLWLGRIRLGCLFSSGKDSCYALHVMAKRGYPVECLVTLKSKNPDSYMFHTPNVNIAKMQAEAMHIPIVELETTGEKEAELTDLAKALMIAKRDYKIQGVITGALYSDYQRQRIEKVCSMLDLRVFSPLWHLNQETEIRGIIKKGFEVIMVGVAAEGLDKKWLGKKLTQGHVDKLAELNEKIGLNIAGEGGEFETLVLDGPVFRKKLVIGKADKEWKDGCGFLRIKKAMVIAAQDTFGLQPASSQKHPTRG